MPTLANGGPEGSPPHQEFPRLPLRRAFILTVAILAAIGGQDAIAAYPSIALAVAVVALLDRYIA